MARGRKITKRLIDSLSTSKPGGLRIFDSEISGFCVTVQATGKKTFGLRYGPRARRRFLKIGDFGTLTAEQAREEARRLRAQVDLGSDPVADRGAKAAADAVTFGDFAAEYLTETNRTRKSADQIRYYIGKAVDEWRQRSINSITEADVRRLFLSMTETPVLANRWLATTAALFASATKKGVIPKNPALDIEANPKNPPRSRVLSDEELERMGQAIEAEKDVHVRAAFRLLLETGCRLGEVLAAKWEDLDLDANRWRLPKTKAGRSQTVILHGSTSEWLSKVPRVGPFIVPGSDPKAPRYDLAKPWRRIRTVAKLGNATVHDIRRTFGRLVAKQAGLHLASALLRHSDVRITSSTYAPLAEAEMREAVAAVLPFVRKSA